MSPPLDIVCWKWKSVTGKRDYRAWHVNRLHDQLLRYTTLPFRMVCITDDPEELHPSIYALPIPAETEGFRVNYRKLWLFSPNAKKVLSPRVFFIDVDTILTGPLDAALSRTEPLVMWRDEVYDNKYGTSSYLMDMGVHPEVWDEYDNASTQEKLKAASIARTGKRHTGSDQAWMNHILPPDLPAWSTRKDGFWRARYIGEQLPKGARVITFPGENKPWDIKSLKKWPWLAKYLGAPPTSR